MVLTNWGHQTSVELLMYNNMYADAIRSNIEISVNKYNRLMLEV